ncbi:hypothetical protein KKF91_04950 [Myxococcota bacterium]|nr:hypothetical protein [Myxococcota bacterium]MBU1429895.1 hypothetical protein [Myxococcota bacterium]MBU1896136.1 hypothetical protein [Myxococcota bacterium]
MYLTGLTRRDHLFELTTRWLSDDVREGDGRLLTEIFLFESHIWGPALQRLLCDVYQRIGDPNTRVLQVHTKGALRRLLIATEPASTPRMRSLYDQFQHNPEEFFSKAPVDMLVRLRPDDTVAGLSRVKRVRRVAEKVSRRVADRLLSEIKQHARRLASERAEMEGLALGELFSSPEQMASDFAQAERITSQLFRRRQDLFTPQDLHIDDIIGSKFVGPLGQLERVEQVIREHPNAQLIEREAHHGDYNAVNLLVDLRLPPPGIIIDRLRAQDWSVAAERGLAAQLAYDDIPNYVEQGARTVRAEFILTTPHELIESEFGRAIHERRILKQRQSPSYSGRIAQNAAYIIEYLLMLAISPKLEIYELPFKMWGQYLPDTIHHMIWHLFGPQRPRLFDTFAPVDTETITKGS